MPDLFDAVHENTPEETRIHGRVLRVRSQNQQNGWAAVTFRRKTGGQISAAGIMPGVKEGESLELEGRWDSFRGEPQFVVHKITPVLPTDRAAMIAFIAGQSKNVGPQMARRIVDRFGEDTWDVLDNHPERLNEIPGVGPLRVQALRDAWKDNQGLRRLSQYLHNTGLQNRLAQIWKVYGDASEGVIRANPYQLAKDVPGIGFKLADEVARKMGIGETDPRRIKAGVLHTLDDLTSEGHLFMMEGPLQLQTAKLLGVPPALIAPAFLGLEIDGAVAIEVLSSGRAIYLSGLLFAEQDSAERLKAMLRPEEQPRPPENHDALIEAFLDRNNLRANMRQRYAIRLAASSKVAVITGGPGTGKSTIIRGIIETVANVQRWPVYLAAPTGRASQRMTEVTGLPGWTIHRLLNYQVGGIPKYNESEKLPTGLYILDELSMVDMALFWRLLCALPRGARLILVGDPDQLPSVGPGNVLHELINSDVIPVAELVEIFRQTEGSRIALNARRIHDGLFPEFNTAGDRDGDCYFLDTPLVADIQGTISNLVSQRLPDYYGFNPLRDIVVLSPMRKGPAGSVELNRIIQQAVNPLREGDPEVRANGEVFRLRDRVMQLKNNYELGIFNGDIGEVVGVGTEARAVEVAFGGTEDQVVVLAGQELDNLVPGYASTIHKCVHPDTLVETPEGLQTIRTLAFEGMIATPQGPKPYRNLITNPVDRALRITTTDGYQITVTPEHGLTTWDGKAFVRQEAADLKKGDWLRTQMVPVFNPGVAPRLPLPPAQDVRAREWKVPVELDEQLALFLGLMVADGTLYRRGFRLAKRHPEVVDTFASLAHQLFGVEVKRFRANNADHAEVNSTQLADWLRSIGGMEPRAKAIPDVILRAPMQLQAQFLRGLFEDGSVNVKGEKLDHIEWATSSPEMEQTVRTMLLRFGIICGKAGRSRKIPTLYIYGSFASRFGALIGFVTQQKQDRTLHPSGDPTRYLIPVSREEVRRLRKLCPSAISAGSANNALTRGYVSRHFLTTVLGACDEADPLEARLGWHHTRIEKIEEVECSSMCVEVPDGHRFLQNGFDGWNSQGSEYPAVVQVIHSTHFVMLQRNLIYTALTRARRLSVTVGNERGIQTAVRNNRIRLRNTRLATRLQEGILT